MKRLVNPTTYFFQQAEKVPSNISPEIQQFVKKLLNKDQCQLCRNPYDTSFRVPRILIHCGHSFCTPCLEQFFIKNRVRCPMCLKLIKQLDSVNRLPINHTIFTHLVQKKSKDINLNVNDKQKKQTLIKDAPKFLFAQFQRVQKEAHRKEQKQKYDDQSGLPFCVFHSDRVEHFYCESHKTFGCRVCIEIGHSKSDCQVVDLYTVDNPLKYQNIMQQKIQTLYGGHIYESKIEDVGVKQPNYNSHFQVGQDREIDPNLIGDDEEDSDSFGQNKSF